MPVSPKVQPWVVVLVFRRTRRIPLRAIIIVVVGADSASTIGKPLQVLHRCMLVVGGNTNTDNKNAKKATRALIIRCFDTDAIAYLLHDSELLRCKRWQDAGSISFL
mmetsp:Transcript_13109/g.27720  ORF Transcript_13109/g.27720 Transcript_13109/m.27720 type:complete len:107 (-) Transcript_13109:37-357(-)